MPARKNPFSSPNPFNKKNKVVPSPQPAPVPVPSPQTPGFGGWMSTPSNPPAALGDVVPVDLQLYFGIKSPNPNIEWPKFIKNLRATHRKHSWAKSATKADVLSEFDQRAGKTAYDYKL